MEKQLNINGVYAPSENIVAREIEDEMILVPLTSGFDEDPEALFSLNETAKVVWKMFDGVRSLEMIITELNDIYESGEGVKIRDDVIALTMELLKRKIIIARQA